MNEREFLVNLRRVLLSAIEIIDERLQCLLTGATLVEYDKKISDRMKDITKDE